MIPAQRASASFTATFRRSTSGSTDWAAATINTPVVNGDHISTGQNARAEIQLDHANILRMSRSVHRQCREPVAHADATSDRAGPGELRSLEEQRSRMWRLKRPMLPFTRRWARAVTASWSTPTAKRSLTCARAPRKFPRRREARVVERDQRITIQGNADNAQYQVSGAPGRDDWDKWNSDRDHTIESAR